MTDVHDALQYFVCGVKNSGMDFSNPYSIDGGNDPGMDEVIFRASYADIPGIGASTVKGHAGEFVLYRAGHKRVAAWCGRRGPASRNLTTPKSPSRPAQGPTQTMYPMRPFRFHLTKAMPPIDHD